MENVAPSDICVRHDLCDPHRVGCCGVLIRFFLTVDGVSHARRFDRTESGILLTECRLACSGLSATAARQGETPKCIGLRDALTPTRLPEFSKQHELRPPKRLGRRGNSTVQHPSERHHVDTPAVSIDERETAEVVDTEWRCASSGSVL